MDYQQESRDFFGGSTIRMPMADFVREHLHLIDVLKHGSRRVQTAEARSQAKELKSRGGRRRRLRGGVFETDPIKLQRQLQKMNYFQMINEETHPPPSTKLLWLALHDDREGNAKISALHAKARGEVAALRNKVLKPSTTLPREPYDPLKPIITDKGYQFRYWHWAYPTLYPEYIKRLRDLGYSDLRIRNETREKVYVTDWLDTPTPPKGWGKFDPVRRLDITDFGVDRREVPTTNISGVGMKR